MTAKYVTGKDGEVERLSMSRMETRLRSMLKQEPAQLIEKIFDLEKLCDEQRMTYFEELHAQRMHNTSKKLGLKNQEDHLKIKYFDETAGLDSQIVLVLNMRLIEAKESMNAQI